MKHSIHIIQLSFLVFALQVAGVLLLSPFIHEGFVLMMAPSLDGMGKEPRSFLQIGQRQKKAFRASFETMMSKRQNGFKLFWFGGSTADDYFYGGNNEDLSNNKFLTIYNLSVPTQSMFDVLRLADNIKGPGTAILAIHPGKMFAHGDSQVVKGRYMTGQNYYFFLQSDAAEKFFRYGGKWESKPKKSMQMFATLNPELAVLKQVIDSIAATGKAIITKFYKNINDGKKIRDSDRPHVLPDDDQAVLSLEERLKKFKKYRKAIDPEKNKKIALNFQILGEIESLLKLKEVSLMILEHPVGSLYLNEMKDYTVLYNSYLTEFIESHHEVQVKKLKWNNFDGDEIFFRDSMHLSEEGAKFFPSLLKTFICKEITIAPDLKIKAGD